MQRIVFTGGGSAGHVVPNLALIEKLSTDNDIFYIGSKDGIEKQLVGSTSIPYYAIASGKLRRYWSLKNFLDPFKIIVGIIQAWWYLGKLKPQVVFSKGGFVAFPVVFAAWLRGIPAIAHESDLTPGLANRLSFPFAKKIALTFTQTYEKLQSIGGSSKYVLTGTPIRESLLNGNAVTGRTMCDFKNDKPCILVIGGGSGSAVINEVVRSALPLLLKGVNVIHCCGAGKSAVSLLPGYKQFEYVNEELAHLYASADMVISRAGANTVYEILALKKPAIFIPLSLKASRGDQIANARWLESKGLCRVLEESTLTCDSLIQAIQENFEQYTDMQERITAYGIKSGTDNIINLINEVTRG